MTSRPLPTQMPIQLVPNESGYGKTFAPMAMFEPHNHQAMSNHCGQGIVRLAERGGVSPCEALAILDDRPWHSMDHQTAKAELLRRIQEYESRNDTSPAEAGSV